MQQNFLRVCIIRGKALKLKDTNFAHLFKLACMCPVDFNMIERGFKQNGIYPFNRKAIAPAKLQIFDADYM